MKIALVFPNYFRQNFFIIPGSFHLPLGLGMIAAVLRDAGHELKVFDATAEKLNIKLLKNKIARFNPDILGISANIAFKQKAAFTARYLKRKFSSIPLIMGGPYPTTEFEEILKKRIADIVIIGEGEVTIKYLIETIQNHKNLFDVRGIAYINHETKNIIKTEPRSLIEDLDSLPFPAWDLFPPPSKYFFATRGSKFYPLMTSRGCPHSCINCTKLIHGYKIRKRSVSNIIDEIKYLHDEFKMNEIFIIDDNFNHDVERAEKICEEIAKLDFKIHIKFTNGLRADKITPTLAWKLKNAGTYEIALGIESGNQNILNKIGKHLKLKEIKKAIKILKKINIIVTGFLMVGVPFENIHSLIDTKDFVLHNDIDVASFFKVVPFKGTPLYDIILKKGKFIEYDKEETNFFSFQPPMFELADLPSELVELAFKDLYLSFFLRKNTILFLLKNINRNNWRWYFNFGLQTLQNAFKRSSRDKGSLKEIIIKKIRKNREI